MELAKKMNSEKDIYGSQIKRRVGEGAGVQAER
jgi:hypothetical protein